MPRLRVQLQRTRRATAWFLLLLCAWMGTGGVLHHTESGSFFAGGIHSPSGLHRLTATTPADSCAACEWTQGLQGRTLTVYVVQFPLFTLRQRSLAPTLSLFSRALRRHSPRAPPVFLFNA